MAKIDGYIISVTHGGKHVGEKRLVRIEEVGRTAATASLVGDPPPVNGASEEAAGSSDDAVQSGTRRRGRRGGRRRSRAKAGAAQEAGSQGADD